jgi:hypothetical protein
MRDGPCALSIGQIGLGDQQPNQMAIDGKKVESNIGNPAIPDRTFRKSSSGRQFHL